ncbi:MAG: hypothetical protein ACYSU0_19240, partial [Planctomycetota bacterium]
MRTESTARAVRVAAAGLVALLVAGPVLAQSEAEIIKPFNGKNLDGWTAKGRRGKNLWKVGTAAVDPNNLKHLVVEEGGSELVNTPPGHGKSRDLYSECKHGDALVELELMVPKGS